MLLAASCVHAPSRDQAGPLASAQRLLAREFGAGVTSSRLARLSELPGTMTDELTHPCGLLSKLVGKQLKLR